MLPIELRKKARNEEVDYLFLKDALKDYAYPRAKMTTLLRKKVLIRVKKGLYIFGPTYANKPYVKETLANLIYGPSYISLEYALSFYGMIPERVESLTSVTSKRDKLFKTPVGIFTYRYLNVQKYTIGITQVMLDDTHPVLIATPEKALADKIVLSSPNLKLKNNNEALQFLLSDLRLDDGAFSSLDIEKLGLIVSSYKNSNLEFIHAAIVEAQKIKE